MSRWMNNIDQLRASCGVLPHAHAPRVVAVLNGNEADITYACTFDLIKGDITLPDNLPGGAQVFADGVLIFTAPIDLSEKTQHQKFPQPHPLAVGIRAAILMEQEAAQQ